MTPARSATPVLAAGVMGATSIACGGKHTCAVVANGQAVCWGTNELGQLGIGAPDATPHPAAARVVF